MLVRIVDSVYNIYDQAYTVTVDVFQTSTDGVSDGRAETYTLKIPKHICPTDESFKATVESYIVHARDTHRIRDWSGLEWRANSL
jgi:hypothetical protein